jgi:Putative transposase DNA-binding domain
MREGYLPSSAESNEGRSATGSSTRMMLIQTTALSFVSWSASESERMYLLYLSVLTAMLSGRSYVELDRFFPSSKLCSSCGHLLKDLRLSVGEWDCPQCGAQHPEGRGILRRAPND